MADARLTLAAKTKIAPVQWDGRAVTRPAHDPQEEPRRSAAPQAGAGCARTKCAQGPMVTAMGNSAPTLMAARVAPAGPPPRAWGIPTAQQLLGALSFGPKVCKPPAAAQAAQLARFSFSPTPTGPPAPVGIATATTLTSARPAHRSTPQKARGKPAAAAKAVKPKARSAPQTGGKSTSTTRKPKSDIELAHRKPRAPSRAFASDRERAAFRVAEEVKCLIPLVPRVIVEAMLGGERGMAQVPNPEARAAFLARLLSERAGNDGATVQQVRLMLRDVREYGAKTFGVADDALDAALFPMLSRCRRPSPTRSYPTRTCAPRRTRRAAARGRRSVTACAAP